MSVLCECGRKVKYLHEHMKRKVHRHYMREKQRRLLRSKIVFENYEQCGLSVESILCDTSNVDFVGNTNRLHNDFINLFDSKIKKEFKKYDHVLKISEHTGHDHNQTDFVLSNGKSLSVKTNYTNKGYKLCPQNIGQSTKKKFICNFNLPHGSNVDEIRCFIENNKGYLLNRYLTNLFCCDFLLWFGIDIQNKTVESFLIQKNDLSYAELEHDKISLLRGNKLKEWKSCRISYQNSVIGEYQIHTNRDCVKFRFHTKSLTTLLGVSY